MELTWVIVIIVLVLGVIVGNITLLKYSAKFKFPAHLKKDKKGEEKQSKGNGFDDEEDDW